MVAKERRYGRHRVFKLLRIKVAATNDNQFLDPAGDEELVAQKSQIPGAQVAGRAAVRSAGGERLCGFLGAVPVTGRDAWTGYPDFADFAWRHEPAGRRINNAHFQVS